jgi:hypothetical protein
MRQSEVVILLCCGSGLDEQAQLYFLIFNFIKKRQPLRADEYKIPIIGNTCRLRAI